MVNGNEWESLKRFNLAEIYQPSPKPVVAHANGTVTGVTGVEAESEVPATLEMGNGNE